MWNPIEHRFFTLISRNWTDQPLRSLDILLAFIRVTTTKKGLYIAAVLNKTAYA